jgi:hypothetical protein
VPGSIVNRLTGVSDLLSKAAVNVLGRNELPATKTVLRQGTILVPVMSPCGLKMDDALRRSSLLLFVPRPLEPL